MEMCDAMKRVFLRWTAVCIAVVCLLFFLFLQFELVKQDTRKQHSIGLSGEIKEEVINDTKGLTDLQVVDYCVQKTSDLLKFSKEASVSITSSDNKGHCVTYAKVCATMCNIAFESNNIPSKAYCVVGYVGVYGINLCEILYRLTRSSFVKDHDFVEVITPNNIIYVDPSIYDLVGMDLKKIKGGSIN